MSLTVTSLIFLLCHDSTFEIMSVNTITHFSLPLHELNFNSHVAFFQHLMERNADPHALHLIIFARVTGTFFLQLLHETQRN